MKNRGLRKAVCYALAKGALRGRCKQCRDRYLHLHYDSMLASMFKRYLLMIGTHLSSEASPGSCPPAIHHHHVLCIPNFFLASIHLPQIRRPCETPNDSRRQSRRIDRSFCKNDHRLCIGLYSLASLNHELTVRRQHLTTDRQHDQSKTQSGGERRSPVPPAILAS